MEIVYSRIQSKHTGEVFGGNVKNVGGMRRKLLQHTGEVIGVTDRTQTPVVESQRIMFAIKVPASMIVLAVLQHVFQEEIGLPTSF